MVLLNPRGGYMGRCYTGLSWKPAACRGMEDPAGAEPRLSTTIDRNVWTF